MKKKFENIAKVVRKCRKEAKLSQEKLSKSLGYKNGQFISNLERGKCGLPANKINITSELLNIDSMRIVDALVLDHAKYLEDMSECLQA